MSVFRVCVLEAYNFMRQITKCPAAYSTVLEIQSVDLLDANVSPAAADKFVSLYLSTKNAFVDLHSREQWDKFVDQLPAAIRNELELRLRKEEGTPRRELFKATS